MYKFSVYLLIVLINLAACAIPKKAELGSTLQEAPEVYLEAPADTIPLGSYPFATIFTDTVLNELIDTMLRYNFELQQANRRINMAEASFLMASRLNKPSLDAVIGVQGDKYGFYTMNGIGNYDMNKSPNITPDMRVPDPFVPDLFVGVRSRWEIDLWGKMRAMKDASKQRLLAQRTGRQWLQTQLIAEMSGLYYEWIAMRYEQEVVDRNVKLQENALDIVRLLKEAGRATELAVQQFTAQVYRTASLRHAIAQNIAVAENRMNYLSGRFPEYLQAGLPVMDQILPDLISGGVPTALLERRPDILVSLHNLTAAYHDVQAARAAFLPSLSITPYFGLQGFRLPSFFNAESIATGLAAQMSAPLLARRQIRGQYTIAESELDLHWLEYKRIFREAVAEVQTSLQGIANLRAQFDLKRQELDVLRNAVNISNELFSNGYANYLEVITAQQSLLEADIELVQIKKQQLQTLVMLYRNTGGGWK